MKKIVLLLLVMVAAFSVNAQQSKIAQEKPNLRRVYVGGAFSLWHDKDIDRTTFQIAPEVGYNFNEKWALGVSIGYGHYKTGDEKANAFGLTPYVRFTYFRTGMVRLFADGNIGFSTYKVKGADATNGFLIGIRPGIAVDLTKNLYILARYGFLGYCDDYAMLGGSTQSIGGLNFDMTTLNFGINYQF
ncbi:MAG: outer membrane beta-barrel protein [Bacteroidales bacterium]|nr:outer membrane beta-barrel protein [Bacteroidales bacterium]